MTSCHNNNSSALCTKSQWVHSIFDSAEAIWLVKIGLQAMLVSYQFNAKRVTGGHFNCQTCSVLSKTLHAHYAHCYLLHRAVCLACIHTSWSWSCSYHVIVSYISCVYVCVVCVCVASVPGLPRFDLPFAFTESEDRQKLQRPCIIVQLLFSHFYLHANYNSTRCTIYSTH